MQTSLSLIKRSLMLVIVMVVTVAFPVSSATTFAEDCTAPANDTPGVHQPVGADAGTYTYQCAGQYSGKYTNQYYVYDPSTTLTTPRYSPDYQYDCQSQKWTKVQYIYSPVQNDFYASRVATSAPASQATTCPVPTSSTPSAAGSSTSSGVSTTGNGSATNTATDQNANVTGTNNTKATMTNGVFSQAGSGNATVSGNTIGGSATTGDAQSIANIANLLQTTSNAFGPKTATFTANINGDVTGDFMFDPTAIMNTGANSANASDANAKLTVNQANNTDASINNTIVVGSQSGNAAVTGNTQAGDASTGNADTIVNLMNLINSTVSAGQSFVGTVNINGNLNGDILLPQNLLNQLLAASGQNSTNNAATAANVNATSTNNTTTAISNDVNTSATSGNAVVSGNTKAGNATTGNAGTNVTLLNLTGNQVVGKNNILVFVNVLGHWVGMIMDAPAGSTAASLGGGIATTGQNSTNSSAAKTDTHATSTNNANLGIHNTVNATAASGDATVKDNTIGGNAKTGNAKTAVNVLNIANTNLNLSDWFGVLFINVFGNWTGSFGVNTSAGDTPSSAHTVTAVSGNSPAIAATAQAATKQFASFVSRGNTSVSSTDNQHVSGSATTTAAQVLGASSVTKAATTLPTADTQTHASYLLPVIGVSIATIMLVGERLVSMRKK